MVNVRCELTAAVPRAKVGPCFALHDFIPHKNQKDADKGGLDERERKVDDGGSEVGLSRNHGIVGRSCTRFNWTHHKQTLNGLLHWASMVSCGQQKIVLETLPRWYRLGSVITRPTEREISTVSKRRGREVPLFAKSLGWLFAVLQQSQVRVGASLRTYVPCSLSGRGVRQTSIKLNFSDPDVDMTVV